MVRHIIARHHGESDAYYKKDQRYPLAIKTRFFSRKVEIYKRRGYFDAMDPNSHRVFADMDSFERVWSDIKEDL